jgi:hypothetical protein
MTRINIRDMGAAANCTDRNVIHYESDGAKTDQRLGPFSWTTGMRRERAAKLRAKP